MGSCKKSADFDDGRVIANMNIEGMRCYRPSKRKAFDEFGQAVPVVKIDKLNRREKAELAFGSASALIVYGALIFGGLGLLMALYFH